MKDEKIYGIVSNGKVEAVISMLKNGLSVNHKIYGKLPMLNIAAEEGVYKYKKA